MTKITKIIVFSLLFILTLSVIYLGIKYYNASKITPNILNLDLSGVIKKGKDIPFVKDYCPNELYIITKDKTYQLRTPDNFNEKPTVAYAKYRDLEVKLTAKFQDVLANCGTQKNCGCDQFILVEKIKETNNDNRNLTEFKGKITCLPLLDGQNTETDCALGFLNSDGKYYILEDIADQYIKEGSNLSLSGEISSQKVVTKYKIDGMINVVEVK